MLGAGSSANINLGFRVYLKDNFSGPAANVKSTLDGLKKEMAMHTDNLTAARNVTAAVGAAALFISKGIFDAAMEGSHFLHTMQGVLAITEATADEFSRLKTLAVTLGRETIFTPDQVASGMRFMAMAGQTAKQIQATAKDATYLAAATLTPLGGKLGAADILTNALKAFGLGVEQSTAMSDMLTYATTSANVQLTDLGNSIRYVAATSRNLNIPVQESIGLLMSLGNAGIQSSMAGTALENMFRYLAMSVSEFATMRQQKTWKNIGLSRSDVMTAEGQFKPMLEVLKLIKGATEGMGAVDLQNVMKEIFGVRGQRAAATLLRNVTEAEGFVSKLHSEGIRGTAAKKSALMMESLQGASLKLKSAIDGLKASFAEALGSVFLNKFLRGLAEIVGWFEQLIKTPVGKWIFSIGTVFITFTGIALTLKAAIWSLSLAFNQLSVSMAGMQAAGKYSAATLLGTHTMIAAGPMKGQMGKTKYLGGWNQNSNQLKYSEKRGMYYVATPGKGGARWIAKANAAKMVSKSGGMLGGLSKVFGSLLPSVARLGGILRGVLSFFAGPWGIAVMLGLSFLPTLIGAVKGLIGATDKNTEALTPKQNFGLTDPLVYALLKDKTVTDIFKAISKNLEKAVELQQLTKDQAKGLTEEQTNHLKLLVWALSNNEYLQVIGAPVQGNQIDSKP